MLRRAFLAVLQLCAGSGVFAQQKPAAPVVPRQPRLVVAIVVDQFRYDYLPRFNADYTSGLRRLLDHGAVFTNARYEHVPTVTAVGHSTFLSGATPAMSGIINNEWWDRTLAKRVTSVSDDATKLLGAPGVGSSPNRLIQSTFGDELKIAGRAAKVIGVSIKDRSAILPSGHMADGAFWFDPEHLAFVSSDYYFPELPLWVRELNDSRPAAKYIGKEWMGHKMEKGADLDASPFGNELIQTLALKALAAEQLGKHPGKTDLLTVSYSSNDYVGHAWGPDSLEVHDMAARVDKLIGALMQAAEGQAGVGSVLFVMTADHGVAPVPEVNQARKMPGGRLSVGQERSAMEQALNTKFGSRSWIADETDMFVYFSAAAIAQGNRAEIENTAAEALLAQPHVFRVYTRTQLLNGNIAEDAVGIRVRNGFNAARSPDLFIVSDPYWIAGTNGTTHGAPFSYDNHVPLIFLGPGIRPGRYNRDIIVNDVAPTLATMLDVETPSGSVGRVLDAMLSRP
jgi:arylsulfatase A-like enzyme